MGKAAAIVGTAIVVVVVLAIIYRVPSVRSLVIGA